MTDRRDILKALEAARAKGYTVIAPRRQDGLVLLRGPSGVEQPPVDIPETPPVAAAVYGFPNPVDLTAGHAVTIAGVPAGGSIAIVAPSGRVLRRITAPDGAGGWRWDLRSAGGRQVPAGIYAAVVRDARDHLVGTARLTLRH